MSTCPTCSTSKDRIEAGNPQLAEVYRVLYQRWGPQHWWPADTQDEMIIGAVLTQNTAWLNVEKALEALRARGVVELGRLHKLSEATLADWIQPAGTYRRKARSLKALAAMVHHLFNGRLEQLLALETTELRKTLLGVHGIGPETADCILLYAAGRPVFVVDAYTRRLLLRHRWIQPQSGYDEIAGLFERSLPGDPVLFGDYHALLVELGKRHCRGRARCDGCPLQGWLPEKTAP